MNKYYKYLFVFLFSSGLFAQSNVNPDISAIGTMNLSTGFTKGTEDYGKLVFGIPDLELFIEGYLNPYSKAVADIAYEEGKISVEELYANVLRGLPLDIQIKAGKYLLGFGKLNTVHAHAWPFLERPLFHQVYLGPDGFNDIGFDINFILPTGDLFTSLDVGIFKGDAIGKTEAADPENQESISALRGTSPIFVGRFNAFFDIDDNNNIEAGISGSYGTHAKSKYYENLYGIQTLNEDKALNYTYLGLDFKYKYKPDRYTAMTIQGEGLLNNRDVISIPNGDISKINTFGTFLSFDYLFDGKYSLGAKYDFTYGIPGSIPGANTLANDDQNKTNGISAWVGYYPVEETLALRLGVQHLIYTWVNGSGLNNDTKATLQLIFSLGPHKAHPF